MTNGTVVFVDILGFGALTQNAIKPSNPCYHAWGEVGAFDPYILATRILSTFRDVLSESDANYSDVSFAQLSDGAFIWGQNTSRVFEAAVEVMQALVKKGVLCRAGGATGTYIEPETADAHLGRFILGEAVTRAVCIESQGKGMRFWCDEASFDAINSSTRSPLKPILRVSNPMEYNEAFEIVWHMPIKRDWLAIPHEDPIAANAEANDFLEIFFENLANLVANPRFIWNEESNQGRIHIEASIEAMLAHLKQYADRYFCDGFCMVNKIKEDIAGFDTRSWVNRDLLQAKWCGNFYRFN